MRPRFPQRISGSSRLLVLWLLSSIAGGAATAAGSPRVGGDGVAPARSMKVVYVPQIGARSSWFAEITCAVRGASALLEPALGRGLRIESTARWPLRTSNPSMPELRADLAHNVDPAGADIVVGLFASPDDPGPSWEEEALSGYGSGVVAMKVGVEQLCEIDRLLAHEIAHIFGGVHRQGENLLMNHQAPGSEIDPLNAELLALHRDRDIRRQPPPLGADDLRTLWGLSAASLDEARTWVVVGVLAAKLDNHEAAARYYGLALERDPDLSVAHFDLGHARLALGDLEGAEACYRRALALGLAREEAGLANNNLAVIRYERGDSRGASLHLEQARALDFAVAPQLIELIRRP